MLHRCGYPKSASYTLVFQLIVPKLFLEDHHLGVTQLAPALQAIATDDRWKTEAHGPFTQAYGLARRVYRDALPERLPSHIDCNGELLRELWRLMYPVCLLTSSADTMQDFFMYFGSVISREDLAQHFTPFPVMQFLVDLVNPQAGESVVDPCCGSADFLAAAMEHAQALGRPAPAVVGYDISVQAVTLARFNMLLHTARARYAERSGRPTVFEDVNVMRALLDIFKDG